MRMTVDEIFALLPAFMRLRDAEEGGRVKSRLAPEDPRPPEDFGPLRTLASLIAREAQIVEEQIDRLYDDAFIETCAPWAIPYLAELLGLRGVRESPEGADLRAQTANALNLRARKGTLSALEQAASEASGLPLHAVEYGRKLVHAQSTRLLHPDQGASADLRGKAGLARLATPFEQASRGAEVRRVSLGGRWNLGNIGLHVWPLRPFSITAHQARPVATGRRDFRFHPLGCDAPLFDRLHARPEGRPAGERDLPLAISRAVMAEDPGRFYGENRAIRVFVGEEAVPLEEIRAAHLGDRPRIGTAVEPPWNRAPFAALTLIDPELGRLVVGRNRSGPVRVSCRFARPFEIGGGEHERRAQIGSVEGASTIPPSAALAERISAQGGAGVFLLKQSTHYASGAAISVPAGGLLRILAAEGCFPTLRLADPLEIRLGAEAELELNGLRLHGGFLRVTGDPAAPGRVKIRDCGFTPGRALNRSGDPLSPGAVSIEIEAPGLAFSAERTILGPISLAGDTEASFTDCALDAGGRAARAIFSPDGAERQRLSLTRCTVLGRVEAGSFSGTAEGEAEEGLPATSDTLFLGLVSAARRQTGCIRFSFLPPGSQTPRLHRCLSGAPPPLASRRFADPDYLLLAPSAEESLRRGAENGGELGVWSRAALTLRCDALARSAEDFLRFGHEAGIFNESRSRRLKGDPP